MKPIFSKERRKLFSQFEKIHQKMQLTHPFKRIIGPIYNRYCVDTEHFYFLVVYKSEPDLLIKGIIQYDAKPFSAHFQLVDY